MPKLAGGGSPRVRAQTTPRLSWVSTNTTIAVLVVITVLFYFTSTVLLPFVLAGLVGFVCTPLVNWLTAQTKWPRTLWAVIVFFSLLAAAAVIGYHVIPNMVAEVLSIVSNFHGIVEGLARRLIGNESVSLFGQPMKANQIADAAVTGLRNWIGQSGRALQLATWSFAALFGFLLTWVLLLYFLIGGPRLAGGLLWSIPPKQRPLAQRIWTQLEPVLWRYFVGVGIVVAYACLAAYIGLGVVLHLRNAIFLALLTGFLEMVPVIGPAIAALAAGAVAIQSAESIWNIIAYAIYATALRLSIDQLLGPIVLGRAASVHPVLVIFCFLVGGILFGATGVILAIPIALSIKVILATEYDEPLPDFKDS